VLPANVSVRTLLGKWTGNVKVRKGIEFYGEASRYIIITVWRMENGEGVKKHRF